MLYRKFAGDILCGCYAPGTDDTKTCDPVTNQCPCKTDIGDPSKAGLKCVSILTLTTVIKNVNTSKINIKKLVHNIHFNGLYY